MSEDPSTNHAPANQSEPVDLFRPGLLVELALALAAAVIGWAIGFNPTASIQLTSQGWPDLWRAAGWGVLATIPMAATVWLMDRYPLGPLREFSRVIEKRVMPLFRSLTIEQMAMLSFAAGVGEEMFFRGLLQAGLEHWIGVPHGRWIALAAASLAFGLCHYVTTTYFVLATLVGVYLGALFLWTDHLLAPMVAHALYDFLAMLYLLRWKKWPSAQQEPLGAKRTRF